ncbi:hypothetical protein SH203_01573 [Brevundimonas sp. SH203]|uniref:hypothetical protein n=1 Tax=Brevundimonas sp. SH203 TaxID=345167 RepID=UPI0009C6112D|nr:hypothetical protein [Brevundimonas sp. SH203]GAW41170.1 hypothetical protein SH203_01573 [Brevundimonas sp. SH203]
MNLVLQARRAAVSPTCLRVRAMTKTPLWGRPWFVRAGLMLGAYQARGVEGGLRP